MRKYLLTGGSGFLGRELTSRLVGAGHDVAWVVREGRYEEVGTISIDDNLEQNIISYSPDVVVHLAAFYSNDCPEKILQCNNLLPIRLLNALSYLPLSQRNFVYAGSYWQYGDCTQKNIAIDLYSASKRSLHSYVDFFHEYKAIGVIELVLYGSYGKSDSRGKILDLLISAVYSGDTLKLSPGNQKLNLLHVDDICEAFLMASDIVRKERCNSHYRVSDEKEYTIRQLIDLIEASSLMKPNVELGVLPYREVEVYAPVYHDELLPGWKAKSCVDEYIKSYFK